MIVERDTSRTFQVKIKLPAQILAPLHNRLGSRHGDSLHYVLLSETENRTLRVFFPHPNLIDRTLHLAFYHRDLPGAVSAITQLLASQKFNILTSLLRKISPEFSVWEAILEYRGEAMLPSRSGVEQCDWVAELLRSKALHEKMPVGRYQVEVGMPLYPKPKGPPIARKPLVKLWLFRLSSGWGPYRVLRSGSRWR